MTTKSEIIEKLARSIWLDNGGLNEVFDAIPLSGNRDGNLQKQKCYSQATAAFNALSEYVTSLEEGSEPLEGDIILGDGCADYVDNFTITNWDELKKHYKAIITRGDKPVITLQKE